MNVPCRRRRVGVPVGLRDWKERAGWSGGCSEAMACFALVRGVSDESSEILVSDV